MALYEWNTRVSAAFFEALQSLEVVLRHAIHQQLADLHNRAGFTGQWLDDPHRLLSQGAREELARARRRLDARGRPDSPGRIIAELPFGMWRALTAKRYETTLWTPALRHAFPHLRPATRHRVHEPLSRLGLLRNRIAHHEPVYRRELARDWRDLLFVAGALCPHVHAWILATSRVEQVLAARPRTDPW